METEKWAIAIFIWLPAHTFEAIIYLGIAKMITNM